MSVRIVLPRVVVCREAPHVMWRAWQKGYASRAVISETPEGWMMVEFLTVVDGAAPESLEAFEIEIDDVLAGITIRRGFRVGPARFSGTGVWTEAA